MDFINELFQFQLDKNKPNRNGKILIPLDDKGYMSEVKIYDENDILIGIYSAKDFFSHNHQANYI